MTVIICDTHVLLYWAISPERLSSAAAEALVQGRITGRLACADITLWEIAMLIDKGRVSVPAPAAQFLQDLLLALRLRVLPITPEIAARAQDAAFQHGDPADRLIAATALAHGAMLISADRQLAQIRGLQLLW
jgi:PIN domain nuclease of toxin-antitoxin system